MHLWRAIKCIWGRATKCIWEYGILCPPRNHSPVPDRVLPEWDTEYWDTCNPAQKSSSSTSVPHPPAKPPNWRLMLVRRRGSRRNLSGGENAVDKGMLAEGSEVQGGDD